MPIPTKKELEEKNKNKVAEPPIIVQPPPLPTPPPPPVVNEIVLNFRKPIEVTINGHKYEGKTITLSDMGIACEIVRIAKEAYGYSILV